MKALYYPYATITSAETLKKSLLYFDNIYIIDPEKASAHTKSKSTHTIEIQELIQTKIVKPISPLKLITKYDSVISESVIADLNDQNFIKFCQSTGVDSWTISTAKVPSAIQDSTFRKYLVNFPQLYEAGIFVGEGPYPYPFLRERHHERRRRFEIYRDVEMPFEVGESIMINHALSASAEYRLALITDDLIHHQALIYKYNRLKDNKILKKILEDYGLIKDVKIAMTSKKILDLTLPSMEQVQLNKILDFKRKHRKELDRFRTHMGALTTELQGNFWDEDFESKVRDMVDAKIKPAVQEIEDASKSFGETLADRARGALRITGVPIILTALIGIPLPLILGAAAGIVTLDEYLDRYQKRRTREKNGVAYLFEAGKHLRSD